LKAAYDATLTRATYLLLLRHSAHLLAAVWPMLQFDDRNAPIQFTLANKGVGPAIVKQVVVKVDDQPVKNWAEVLENFFGPGYHPDSSAITFQQ
jgi:hypothetical protein